VADWYILDSGAGNWDFNMAMDEVLLFAMPVLSRPVLRCYGWRQRASSFGYFQKYAEVEKMTQLRPLVRRPTGGGLVPHDADWTYSVAIPTSDPWYELNACDSYRRVHRWLEAAFERLGSVTELAAQARRAGPGQCFVGYEQFDLLWQGMKIAGAAQRRTRQGLLIQGSVQPPPPVARSRGDWQEAMLRSAGWGDEVKWSEPVDRPELEEKGRKIAAEKYSQKAYNQRR
jgi:lipoate-protein ligase A